MTTLPTTLPIPDSVEAIGTWISHLETIKRDYEAAHSDEDRLHRSVLYLIAEGTPHHRELALAALDSRDVNFVRYCA